MHDDMSVKKPDEHALCQAVDMPSLSLAMDKLIFHSNYGSTVLRSCP